MKYFMFKLKGFSFTILGMGCLFSCQTFDDDLDPIASFSLSSNEVNALEIIELTSTGRGEFFTVYKGTNGNRYDNRDNGDTGIAGNDQGKAFFSYDTAGTFMVTFVVSSFADGKTKEEIATQIVNVRDTVNTISRIVYNKQQDDDENLGSLGSIQRINGSFPYRIEAFPDEQNRIIVPVFNFKQFGFTSRTNLEFIPDIYINSNAATFTIQNNQGYELGDEVIHYNFESRFRPITYEVTSQTKQSVEYLVSVMEIPEFQSFNLSGSTSGINRIHPVSDFTFFLSAPLEEGVDATSVTPTFELYFPDETTVSHNGNSVESGVTPFDLTNQVKFDLEFVQEGFESDFSISSGTYVRAVDVPGFDSFSIDGVEAEITLVQEGNPAEYHVDLTVPLPAGEDVDTYLRSLIPVFVTSDTDAQTIVSTSSTGVQVSGESREDFRAYYLASQDPSLFNIDDERKVYTIRNFYDAEIDGTLFSEAFSIESIFKVGVLIE